ncbi:MAG: hypothetical protein WCK26_04290, partial [Candidatus Saccharibacteria bacterium]
IYTKLPDNKSIIRYKRTNSNYEIITQSEKTVEYVSKSKLSIDDTLSIKNQTTTFMKNNGLNVDDYNPKADQFSSYMTYGDDDVICQLYSTAKKQVSGENYPYHRLSCVNITAVNNNYSQIENLLTIYKKSNSLPEFSKVLVSTKTDGKKSYSIINLVGDGASPRLLFAAISGDWAYLGELPERNFKDKNSNYILDSELSSKINDPKYGDFIAKDIK